MLTDQDTVRIGDTVEAEVLTRRGCIALRHTVRGTVKDVDRFGVLAEMDNRPGELHRLAWLHHGLSWRLIRPAV